MPRFEGDFIDATNFERAKYRLLGDKAEVIRTNVLRRFPFPEFENENFVTEGVCWDRIAAEGLKLRWFKEVIYICEYREDGLTKTGANSFEGHKKNYKGYCFYIKQSMAIKPKIEAVAELREYNKTGQKLGKSMGERAQDIGMPLMSYLWNLVFVMPINYAFRLIRKVCRKISRQRE